MDRENARRKVKGLLAMAKAGSGATEAERETAQRLADELMKKYGFKLADKPAARAPQDPYFPGHFRFTTNANTNFDSDFIFNASSFSDLFRAAMDE